MSDQRFTPKELALVEAWMGPSAGNGTDAARRAGLDTYTPQTQDRLWNDWTDHHGGGM